MSKAAPSGTLAAMSFDSVSDVLGSVRTDAEPPAGTSPELRALWFAKKGEWHRAHDIASDIHTPLGSWIHAHLHVLEGDLGNAGYWYNRAGRPPRPPEEAGAEWGEIVGSAIATGG